MQRSSIRYGQSSTEQPGRRSEITLHPGYINDLALWRAFKSGDEKALITIFERFTPSMFNYGYKITPDADLVKDAIQELFIEIWQKRERLGDTDSIKYYLYRSLRRKLARIKAKSHHEILKALSHNDDDHVEVAPSHEFVLIKEQGSREQTEKLSAMLNILTKRQKEAMFLRYFNELSCDEIAMIMGLSKQTVYNLIHDAILQLRKAAGV